MPAIDNSSKCSLLCIWSSAVIRHIHIHMPNHHHHQHHFDANGSFSLEKSEIFREIIHELLVADRNEHRTLWNNSIEHRIQSFTVYTKSPVRIPLVYVCRDRPNAAVYFGRDNHLFMWHDWPNTHTVSIAPWSICSSQENNKLFNLTSIGRFRRKFSLASFPFVQVELICQKPKNPTNRYYAICRHCHPFESINSHIKKVAVAGGTLGVRQTISHNFILWNSVFRFRQKLFVAPSLPPGKRWMNECASHASEASRKWASDIYSLFVWHVESRDCVCHCSLVGSFAAVCLPQPVLFRGVRLLPIKTIGKFVFILQNYDYETKTFDLKMPRKFRRALNEMTFVSVSAQNQRAGEKHMQHTHFADEISLDGFWMERVASTILHTHNTQPPNKSNIFASRKQTKCKLCTQNRLSEIYLFKSENEDEKEKRTETETNKNKNEQRKKNWNEKFLGIFCSDADGVYVWLCAVCIVSCRTDEKPIYCSVS